MTFKPGDKVRVIADAGRFSPFNPGDLGTVLEAPQGDGLIRVDFNGTPGQCVTGHGRWYAIHDELEPAP